MTVNERQGQWQKLIKNRRCTLLLPVGIQIIYTQPLGYLFSILFTSLFFWSALLFPASKGHSFFSFFFYGTWETELGRGPQRGRWLAEPRAWLKRLRCTNKTATHTDSSDAYYPPRGCLTAAEVALAGRVPARLHTYCNISFYGLQAETPKSFYNKSFKVRLPSSFQGVRPRQKGPCQGFLKVVRKWEGKCVH